MSDEPNNIERVVFDASTLTNDGLMRALRGLNPEAEDENSTNYAATSPPVAPSFDDPKNEELSRALDTILAEGDGVAQPMPPAPPVAPAVAIENSTRIPRFKFSKRKLLAGPELYAPTESGTTTKRLRGLIVACPTKHNDNSFTIQWLERHPSIAPGGLDCPVRMYNPDKPDKYRIDFFILSASTIAS